MPTTRLGQKAALPTAAALKAELMKKSMDGYINAEKMISPWNFGTTSAEQETARQHILSVALTPENRALIEKIKTYPSIIDEKSRLKKQLKALTEGRDLAAEASKDMSIHYTYGTGGRKKTRKGKSKKSRKTRGRRRA